MQHRAAQLSQQLGAVQAGDAYAIVGGPGVSYWVSANPGVAPQDDRASATGLVQLAVTQSLPLDFVSFHDVTNCADPSSCTDLEVRWGVLARAQGVPCPGTARFLQDALAPGWVGLQLRMPA